MYFGGAYRCNNTGEYKDNKLNRKLDRVGEPYGTRINRSPKARHQAKGSGCLRSGKYSPSSKFGRPGSPYVQGKGKARGQRKRS